MSQVQMHVAALTKSINDINEQIKDKGGKAEALYTEVKAHNEERERLTNALQALAGASRDAAVLQECAQVSPTGMNTLRRY